MLLAGLIIQLILNKLVYSRLAVPHSIIFDYIFSVVCTIVLWEANIQFDQWLNKRLPWLPQTAKRAFIQFGTSILFSSVLIYLAMFFYGKQICGDTPEHDALMKEAIIICILIISIILVVETAIKFFSSWKSSLVEVEKYKLESAQAQLQNLKNQINPHFLFNNMSVLSSLVYQNQDKAVEFINQLSNVYRYLLDNRNNEIVPLEQELTFLNAYIYLLQIRFDTSITFNVKVEKDKLRLMIPPMTLQILVENCIKHNEISKANPLQVTLFSTNDRIVVRNNLQRRIDEEHSPKTGLQNIKQRFAYLTDKEIEILEDGKIFEVSIPLLPAL